MLLNYLSIYLQLSTIIIEVADLYGMQAMDAYATVME